MGDNLLTVSRAEVDDHGRKVREQTETTVTLLERLMNFAETTQKRQHKLEEQLAEESASRKASDEKVKQLEKEVEDLHDKSADLSSKLEDLGHKYEKKDDEFKSILPAKEKEIEKLKETVAASEGMLTGVKYLRRNVDSFRFGQDQLQEPCGVCMLPDGRLVVADTSRGLLLFSGCTELVRTLKANEDEWKWPQSLVYDSHENRIVVALLKRSSDRYRRTLAIFDTKLDSSTVQFVDEPDEEKRGFDAAAQITLTYSFKAGAYFMAIADKTQSSVYSLAVGTTKWTEIISKSSATYTDLQILSYREGTVELLCIERRMSTVHKFAVNGSDVFYHKILATVEKPSALCVDQTSGELFIHDGISGKIYEFDTLRFDPKRQIGLVDDHPYAMSASNGYVGVATRDSRIVQVFRYRIDAEAFAGNEDT